MHKSDVHQRFMNETGMDFKNANDPTLQERASILKTADRLVPVKLLVRQIRAGREAADALSFMEQVDSLRERSAFLAAAISQLERLKSSSHSLRSCPPLLLLLL